MEVARGDIWWAAFRDAAGSEPGFRRPVLVVQGNAFNRSRLRTTIVVVLTSNLQLLHAPGNALIPAKQSGLPRDSVANVTQVVTIDRSILTSRVGRVQPAVMAQVRDGLLLSLDLS